ncbi:hypothetical protein [Tepidiforma flava]|uniref:hypothetical protein n=1 Tax=Tepidiforma flava TaxID=3004094 RepID=UPI003570F87C
MEAAKGAVFGLLQDAYLRRDRVAFVAFDGRGARLLLAPTRSVDHAQRAWRSSGRAAERRSGQGWRRLPGSSSGCGGRSRRCRCWQSW